MKQRHHAATLALVAWYLMVPPVIKVNGHPTVLTMAPLQKWDIEDSFDTATQCSSDQDAG
ncbi:MAG: hypothetical protein Q7S58_01945 [Candidatus Binatus sp.]|uniref:hypothetical protein n=1 Tax=Candidatus Binatus sp. TaxID=2811406 RepID=UPI00271FD3D8|nr:hypothetical protein [Candidatus Binatus sp.]MDO8431151.1 hypothetical protein [Candidatus Binatus sp.]